MDVHPPKNGINRYWSIPSSLTIFFTIFFCWSHHFGVAVFDPFSTSRWRRVEANSGPPSWSSSERCRRWSCDGHMVIYHGIHGLDYHYYGLWCLWIYDIWIYDIWIYDIWYITMVYISITCSMFFFVLDLFFGSICELYILMIRENYDSSIEI